MHPTAAQSLFVRRSAPMTRFVAVSVGLHALALVGLVAASLIRPPPIDLSQKPIHASLVRLGKARDQKLLPQKDEAPPPPKKVDAPDQTKAPEPKVDERVAVPVPGQKPEPKQKQAGKDDSKNAKKSLFNAFNKVSKTADELQGAEDGDPNGDSATQEGERYFGQLTALVKRYYDVSQTISDDERTKLHANVLFRINRTGALLDVKLAEPSGNNLFDAAVLSAVKKAAPFSPPPDHLRDELQAKGVVLVFTP